MWSPSETSFFYFKIHECAIDFYSNIVQNFILFGGIFKNIIILPEQLAIFYDEW